MRERKTLRLSRGWKMLRNLAASGLLAVLLWGMLSFPAPDLQTGFRWAERANWAGPSDIQGIFETGDRWVAATCQDQVLLYCESGNSLRYWPRNESGTTLVPVPESRLHQGEVWIVAADVPQGAASARLNLETACYYTERRELNHVGREINAQEDTPGGWQYGPPQRWQKVYTVSGEMLKEGGFLFHVSAEDQDSGSLENWILSYAYEWDIYTREREHRAIDCAMEAVFYDEMGRELEREALDICH